MLTPALPLLLADENFPAPSIVWLRNRGFDVMYIRESHPGLDDVNILALAAQQARWIITFDRDYGELVFKRRLPAPPSITLMRLIDYHPELPGQLFADRLQRGDIRPGLFVLIDDLGIRPRAMPPPFA